jgi:hypothetical protein
MASYTDPDALDLDVDFRDDLDLKDDDFDLNETDLQSSSQASMSETPPEVLPLPSLPTDSTGGCHDYADAELKGR